jgi:hypothetical protein
MFSHVRKTGLVLLLSLAVLAVAPLGGLTSNGARAATEYDSLVSYLSFGKLKVGKKVTYQFACATDCQVTARSTLVLPGPNLGPVVDTAIFAAGQTGRETLTLNKAARTMIKSHLGASKLRTSLTASTSTGLTDSDSRVFKFKR